MKKGIIAESFHIVFFVVCGFLFLFSCDGDSGDIIGCTPGGTQSCLCSNGSNGVQTCNSDSETWGECSDCENSDVAADDFVGTWTGDYTFSNGDSGQLTVVFTENSGVLTGAIDRGMDNGQPRTDTLSGTFANSTFTFNMSTDSTHPDCVNFNPSGTATLDSNKTSMTLSAEGNFCSDESYVVSAILSE